MIPEWVKEEIRRQLADPTSKPELGCNPLKSLVKLEDEEAPVSSVVEEAAELWLKRQRDLWTAGIAVVAELEEFWPTPTFEDVVNDTAVFPPHHDAWWFNVLKQYPLATQLEVALSEGKAAVEAYRSNSLSQ